MDFHWEIWQQRCVVGREAESSPQHPLKGATNMWRMQAHLYTFAHGLWMLVHLPWQWQFSKNYDGEDPHVPGLQNLPLPDSYRDLEFVLLDKFPRTESKMFKYSFFKDRHFKNLTRCMLKDFGFLFWYFAKKRTPNQNFKKWTLCFLFSSSVLQFVAVDKIPFDSMKSRSPARVQSQSKGCQNLKQLQNNILLGYLIIPDFHNVTTRSQLWHHCSPCQNETRNLTFSIFLKFLNVFWVTSSEALHKTDNNLNS